MTQPHDPGYVPPPPLPGQQSSWPSDHGYNAPPQPTPSYPGYHTPQPSTPAYPGFGVQPNEAYGSGAPMGAWPPAPPKKRRTGLIVTITVATLAVIAGVTGYAMWQSAAEAEYEAAVDQLANASDDVRAAVSASSLATTVATEQQLAADTIEQTSTAGLLDASLRETFTQSLTTLDTALEEAPAQLTRPRQPTNMPDTPWGREEAAAEISALAAETRDDINDYQAGVTAIEEASAAVDTAAADLFGSATATTDAVLAANVSAKNETKVSFQNAAATLAEFTTLDGASAAALETYADAAATLATSQQDELDEKAGPLMTARLEVEQFARDLAPGIMLDFDWAPIVAGSGGGLSVGGTTHWWMDPGYATITLSNSVAELWGSAYDPMVRALVAHEIGHALTIRCGDMYDWSTQEGIEQWATAWAIVNGYTGEGNGVSVYGQPPQSMLDAARGCS